MRVVVHGTDQVCLIEYPEGREGIAVGDRIRVDNSIRLRYCLVVDKLWAHNCIYITVEVQREASD